MRGIIAVSLAMSINVAFSCGKWLVCVGAPGYGDTLASGGAGAVVDLDHREALAAHGVRAGLGVLQVAALLGFAVHDQSLKCFR